MVLDATSIREASLIKAYYISQGSKAKIITEDDSIRVVIIRAPVPSMAA